MPSVSTSLAQSQREFMAHLLEEERALPANWNDRQAAGMEIYRNAYRARLVDALRETYERTAKWVGEDAFRQAAAHHVIVNPPRSWTLDDVGDGFVDTVAELFAQDPEVAELAWLEWSMHRCFVAPNAEALDAAGFAMVTAAFEGDDWANLRLQFLPGTHQCEVAHDVAELWRALAEEQAARPDFVLAEPVHCIVWREGIKPVFMQVDIAEGAALSMMHDGKSYGEMCDTLIARMGEEQAVKQAGAMLGRWIHHGMISGLRDTIA